MFLSMSLMLSVLAIPTLAAESYEAQIGGTSYATLKDAFGEAQTGETITLLADCKLGADQLILDDGRNVTIDLNGFNITRSERLIEIKHGTLTLTGQGTLEENSPNYAPLVLSGSFEPQENYTVLNVGPDVTLEGWAGVFITTSGSSPSHAYGVVVNVAGKIVSVKDKYESNGHCIYLNGNYTDSEGPVPEINIASTAEFNGIGNGIYAAGYGVWNIADGAQISGGSTGIEIRAGVLNIAGGTITGGKGELKDVPNGNGSTTENNALGIAQHTTKLPIIVNITGGSFEGTAALNVANPQDNIAADLAKISVDVSGGAFYGVVESVLTKYPELTTYPVITRGSFDNDPSAFVPEGVAITKIDGLWWVGDLPAAPDEDEDSSEEHAAQVAAEREFWESLTEELEELTTQLAEASAPEAPAPEAPATGTQTQPVSKPALSLDATSYETIPYWAVDALARQNATLKLTYIDAEGKVQTVEIDCATILKTEPNRVFFRIEDFVERYAPKN